MAIIPPTYFAFVTRTMGIKPIDIVIKEIADLYFIKSNKKMIVLDKEVDIDSLENFKLLPHSAFTTLNNIVNFNPDHAIKIFTDGSVSSRGTGAAFCVLHHSQLIRCTDFKLDQNCSITQAELFAIQNSLKYVLNCRLNNVLVCTDSQAALLILTKPPIKSRLYFDTYLLFKQCILQFQTKLCWIKGHSGCAGNELADLLATSAYLNSTVVPLPLPMSFAHRKLNDISFELWNNRWQKDEKGLITHKFFPTVYDCFNVNLSTQNFILTQFLSGHGKFYNYLYRFKILNCGFCNCGENVTDSVLHIIYDCNLFACWRRKLIDFFVGRLIPWPADCSLLVYNQEILTLIKKCVLECSTLFGPQSSGIS